MHTHMWAQCIHAKYRAISYYYKTSPPLPPGHPKAVVWLQDCYCSCVAVAQDEEVDDEEDIDDDEEEDGSCVGVCACVNRHILNCKYTYTHLHSHTHMYMYMPGFMHVCTSMYCSAVIVLVVHPDT